jgi:hypothetical protein
VNGQPRSIAQMLADRPRTGIVKPTEAEQFREMAEMYRMTVRTYSYRYLWFSDLFRNYGRMSPKCCCWLARECFDEMYKHYQEIGMPKVSSKTPDDKKDFRDWGFVNVQLSDDQREAALLDYADPDALWETLVIALRDGYKVTLSYDGETESYCAALSGTNCGKPNERLTLTAWGSDETDALKYVFYKHVTVLGLVWQKPGAKQQRLG